MKKLVKPIICAIGIIILIVAVLVLAYLVIKTIKDGYANIEHMWVMSEQLFAIIGSVATALAVVVALFKEDILQIFHSPELSIEKYSQGIIPIVKVDGKSAGESYYKCEMKINNIGTDNARNCSLVMSRFLYNVSRMGGESLSEWDDRQIRRVMEIGEKNNQIVSGLDARIELFRINNPLSSSTPSGGENKAYIVFPQTELDDEIASESNFEIDYEIRADNASPLKFHISVEWAGRWYDSVSEMSGFIKVKIA